MALQLLMPDSRSGGSQELLQVQHQPEQALSVQQSLQLVKIFLNSSIACICHTRELLRWTSDCLRTRYIEQVTLDCNSAQIYEAFLNAGSTSPSPSQQVRVLVRSDDAHANNVLDMLENGVFDAVSCGFLETLQVFVASSEDSEKSVLETYTYHFEYEDDRVTSVNLEGNNQPFTLARSQKSFKAAIRGLLRAMQELPRLPRKCVLGMSMSYNDACPDIYEPDGFVTAAEHTIAEPDWSTMWAPSTTFDATFESTHHQVKIAAKGPWKFDLSTSQVQDTAISKQLDDMQNTSSSRNRAFHSTLPVGKQLPGNGKGYQDQLAYDGASKRKRPLEQIETEDSVDQYQRSAQNEQANGDIQQATMTEANMGLDKKAAAPLIHGRGSIRRRKKSISRMFVPTAGSTPVSQRHHSESTQASGKAGVTRESRASSTEIDYD